MSKSQIAAVITSAVLLAVAISLWVSMVHDFKLQGRAMYLAKVLGTHDKQLLVEFTDISGKEHRVDLNMESHAEAIHYKSKGKVTLEVMRLNSYADYYLDGMSVGGQSASLSKRPLPAVPKQ